MRVVITDSSFIWNNNNQALEIFKEVLLVVCLEGEKVSNNLKRENRIYTSCIPLLEWVRTMEVCHCFSD